jgi:hypothetical protein
MADTPLKAHCPKCGAGRNVEIVAKHKETWDDANAAVWGATDYRILKCKGCDQVFFQTCSVCDEDVSHTINENTGEEEQEFNETITSWPAPAQRAKPDWLRELCWFTDDILHSLLDDIYTALDNDLRVFAAIGLRTLFDRASELLGVDQSANFAQKLKALVDMGKISPSERDILDVLTDAGSAAAHRGWKPNVDQLKTLMTIAEQFIHRTFILEAAARELKKKIPQRGKTSHP